MDYQTLFTPFKIGNMEVQKSPCDVANGYQLGVCQRSKR